MKDILFKGALICDGSGAPARSGDLLVYGGLIKAVAPSISRDFSPGAEVVEADGAWLAPGFIDIHGHSDLEILRLPALRAKMGQGFTSDVGGNCGAGVFPCARNPEAHRASVRDILGVFAEHGDAGPGKDADRGKYAGRWPWFDYAGYRERVEAVDSPVSLISLQAHGALRWSQMEDPSRPAGPGELKRMVMALDLSLEQGCAGLSTGLYYAPCCYAGADELELLCRTVAARDALFTVHHRNEGALAPESLKEVLEIALKAGVRTQISHLKVIGRDYQHRVEEMLALIDLYAARGLDLAFDQYPYLYGSTSLWSLLPPNFLKKEEEERKRLLREGSCRRDLAASIAEPGDWDSLVPLCGFDQIFLNAVNGRDGATGGKLEDLRGLSLAEGAALHGCDPFDFLFDVLAGAEGAVTMIDYTQSEDSLLKIMSHPRQSFGTDALFAGDHHHPRTYNAVYHLFDRYHNQLQPHAAEELVRRLSYANAARLGLKDRGLLKEGLRADLVLFRPDGIRDHSDPGEPDRKGEGIIGVFSASGATLYPEKID